MHLHRSILSPLLHSSSKSNKPPSRFDPKALSLLIGSYEGSLLRLLRSLLISAQSEADNAPAVVSFTYLSRAAGVLSSVHLGASALFSDPSVSGSDEAAIASYISSSIKLLDIFNAVSAEIERLQLGRLVLVFVARLLSGSGGSPPPEMVQKARKSILEWQDSFPKSRRIGAAAAAAALIRDLQPRGSPPARKATPLGRAVYAAEAVSALVAGVLVSFLGGEVDVAGGTKVPQEFAWAKAFNELQAELSSKATKASPVELEAVRESVKKLADIMDEPSDNGDNKTEERRRSAVAELERATAEMTETLDRLLGAVNELFRAVLCTRNTALKSFRP